MIVRCVKAIIAFMFASPAHLSRQNISCVTGNGGFDLEDANFNRKK